MAFLRHVVAVMTTVRHNVCKGAITVKTIDLPAPLIILSDNDRLYAATPLDKVVNLDAPFMMLSLKFLGIFLTFATVALREAPFIMESESVRTNPVTRLSVTNLPAPFVMESDADRINPVTLESVVKRLAPTMIESERNLV